jgi:hypothetical protein
MEVDISLEFAGLDNGRQRRRRCVAQIECF